MWKLVFLTCQLHIKKYVIRRSIGKEHWGSKMFVRDNNNNNLHHLPPQNDFMHDLNLQSRADKSTVSVDDGL